MRYRTYVDSPITKKSLLDELTLLSNLQNDALQNAAYINMDAATTAQYDIRALRIAEIIKLLR